MAKNHATIFPIFRPCAMTAPTFFLIAIGAACYVPGFTAAPRPADSL
jgi:hypothetical protein